MPDEPAPHILLDPELQEPPWSLNGHQVHEEAGEGQPRPPVSTAHDFEDDILNDHDLVVQRAQTWTGITRFGFNAMLASPEYKNKLRLKPDKMERIVYFLTKPDAKIRDGDRADSQAKHQARLWMYQNGILYRRESRLQQPRRHVSASEVFNILTAEHLRSGHHGRDKLLRVLEVKYIGYTKPEVMYILDHCPVCSNKHIRGAVARRRNQYRQSNGFENGPVTPNPE